MPVGLPDAPYASARLDRSGRAGGPGLFAPAAPPVHGRFPELLADQSAELQVWIESLRPVVAPAEPAPPSAELRSLAPWLADADAPLVELVDDAKALVPEFAGGYLVERPPGANRGVELTTAVPRSYLKLDWLSCTVPIENLDALVELVAGHLGKATSVGHGFHSYRESVRWPSKAFVAWTPGRREALLSLNGDSCDLVPPVDLPAFFRGLAELDARGSHVDAAFTDGERIASMDDVHAAAEACDFAGFLLTDSHRPRKRGVLVGDSRDFGRRGKRGSGAFYQVYDKLLECRAKGVPDIDAIRYEVRFDGCKARAAFARLVAAAVDGPRLAAELGLLVGGSIDFLRRTEGVVHLDRLDRLPWWDRIVERIGASPLCVDRVVPSLVRSLYFLGKQWMSVMARGVEAFGARSLDFIGHLEEAIGSWERSNGVPSLSPLDLRFDPALVFTELVEVSCDG